MYGVAKYTNVKLITSERPANLLFEPPVQFEPEFDQSSSPMRIFDRAGSVSTALDRSTPRARK